jgi:hypothetical protein
MKYDRALTNICYNLQLYALLMLDRVRGAGAAATGTASNAQSFSQDRPIHSG